MPRITLTTLALASTLVLVLMAPAGAGPAFNRPPRVVDATGRVIGSLIGVDPFNNGQDWHMNRLKVLRRVQGGGKADLIVQLGVYLDGYIENDSASYGYHYETTDCSGSRYLIEGGVSPDRNTRTLQHGSTNDVSLVRVEYAGELQSRSLNSALNTDIQPTDCVPAGGTLTPEGCCVPSSDYGQLSGPPVVLDLSGLTPPFRIK